MSKYRLTIDHDPDTELPENIGRIISFSSRHVNFEHPDEWLAVEDDCESCDTTGYANNDPNTDDDCDACKGVGYTTSTHPDVLAIMSYYEHGSCRWMVGESVVPDHGNFDTVNVAGVMVWDGEDNERAWWDDTPADRQRSILDSIADEYTMWANGETYIYVLESLSTCDECSHVASDIVIDGCGGIIGTECLIEMVREAIEMVADADDIEIGGECGHVIQASDLISVDDALTEEER